VSSDQPTTEGFRRACAVADLVSGAALPCVVDGEDVAVVRVGEETFAIADRCSHADVALSEGDIDGRTIECWLHGSRFDLATGKPTGPPATESVPVYPVFIDDGDVFIGPAPITSVTSLTTSPTTQEF
jgi:3-phenylpropionate/trans-cinnamate dioxygenase ferredoxin component